VLTVRDDDRPEAIRLRLKLYAERTELLYGYYRASGRLRTVDAEGTESEVFARCLAVSEPMMAKVGRV
jgi:adenylate kinase